MKVRKKTAKEKFINKARRHCLGGNEFLADLEEVIMEAKEETRKKLLCELKNKAQG